MILRKQSIVLVLTVLLSLAQAKDECPLQCDCSDDLSVVRCRGMDKFPVFNFSSKVKTLDVTYGNIKHIYEKDVKRYTNLENLFISHNPLDCDHATTHTLKHVLKETIGLKSFDGHKIKCQQMRPLMSEKQQGNGHHRDKLDAFGGRHIHLHPGTSRDVSPLTVAGAIAVSVIGVLCLAGFCLIFVNRHKLFGGSELGALEGEYSVGSMEEVGADTSVYMLIEGLRKQRRESQGYPKNAIVDSDSEEVVEKEEYVKGKMKKQRRLSQGYAEGSGSSDDEPGMVEINLNEDLYSSRK